MTKEKLEQKIDSLTAAISTMDTQIKELAPYKSYLQVRIWRKHRIKLNNQKKQFQKQLKQFKTNG